MALTYLPDENLRGVFWRQILRHNSRSAYPIDIVRVGDPPAPPLRTPDPQILLWAEAESRILVSRDESTLANHLAAHLDAGHYCPGIMIPLAAPAMQIVEFLLCAAYASEPSDWENQINYIP